jgi:hypothetical protein
MKKKYIILLLLITLLHSKLSLCQCSVTINYTTGSNGLVNFTSNVTGTGPFNYSWDFGDTSFAFAANPSHYYWYNATYTACLVIVDSLSFNCSDTACIPVTVTNASQYALCPGNAAFSAVPNGTATLFTNTSGTWTAFDFGDGISAAGTAIYHQYQFNGTYQVTAIAYSYFGSNFLPCDTSVQNIVVSYVPCNADFYIYSDTSSGYMYAQNISLGYANVTWYVDGIVVSNNTDTISSTLLPGTHTICLAITGPGGCSDSTCQVFTLNYTPSCSGVTFSASPLGGCDTYQFAVNNTGPPLTSINWYLDSGWLNSLSTFPLTLDFTAAQNTVYAYNILVNAQGNGCASSQSFYFVNPASFSIWLDWDTTGGGNNNTWYAYPQYSTGVTYELWDFGDGITSTLPYPAHVYATAGYYNVCHTVTLNGSCTYTYCVNQYFFRGAQSQGISNFVVVGPTGISSPVAESEINVYPNPASGELNIDYPEGGGSDYSFVMTDLTGRKVLFEIFSQSLHHASLRTDKLSPGTYFYEFCDSNRRVKSGKVMIVK